MKVQQLDVVAAFQSFLEQGSGHLGGPFIRQRLSGAVLILHPRGVRQSHDDACSVDAKLNVDRVTMA